MDTTKNAPAQEARQPKGHVFHANVTRVERWADKTHGYDEPIPQYRHTIARATMGGSDCELNVTLEHPLAINEAVDVFIVSNPPALALGANVEVLDTCNTAGGK